LTALKRPEFLMTSLNRSTPRAGGFSRVWAWAAACLLLALSTGPGLFASSKYTVDVWGTDKGLPEGAVISMIQTRDGYLWLGTLKGLARFDGIHFTVFDERNTPELNAGEIVHLFEDSEGNLWVGTQSAGVVLVRRGRVTSLSEMGWRSLEQRVLATCEDPSGTVWLANAAGQLCQYSHGQPHVSRSYGPIKAMAMENSGIVWLGLEGGMTRPSEIVGFDTRAAAGSTNTVFHDTLAPGSLDFLLASRYVGLWRFADGRIEKWIGNQKAGNSIAYPWHRGVRITSACEDQEGNLVVGTLGKGLFWFDSQGGATCISTNDHQLSNNSILSMVMDREGSLWVGTDGGGLNRVRKKVFDVVEATRGSTVQSVCDDGEGGLWIGFNVWGDNTNSAAFLKNGELRHYGVTNNASVLSVLVDAQKRVWAGAAGALFRLQDQAFQPQIGGPIITEMFADRGNHVWLGSRNYGLFSWDEHSRREFTTSDGLSTNDVRALAQDRAGDLWIGTRGGGLNRFREGKFTAFHKQDGLPSDNISSLYVDDQDVLWVGTDGCGLARLHGNSWTNYTTEDGLTSDSIGYLVEDGEGYLWIGSNTGLMRVRKRELNDFAAGKTNSVWCRSFGKEDGLPDNECTSGSQPGACRTRDGKLWFPTIKGLASVDPKDLRLNANPPPGLIESVAISGERQGTNSLGAVMPASVTVQPGREQFDFQYTSLNLAAPERARFRYRLEGYEKNWVEAGDRRTAPYTKVPPGDYHFHVIACNEDGVWNEQGAMLDVSVLPPFWRKWWFVTSVLLAVLFLIVGSVYYVSTQRLHRQLEGLRQQQALEKERARIARDIHDQVGASLTQVSLLGEMVESDKDEPKEVEAHGRQISQTARETARSLDEIVWTVNPSNDTLDGLINYVCKYAQDYFSVAGLRYRLDAPPQLPATPISPEVRHNVFLASKESITNIVKHARATSAWIKLRLDPGVFTLEIQDDGRGPAGMDAKAAQSRNGVRNMRKRLEDIGGTFTIGPALERGTIVRLRVPIKIMTNVQ
jgi:ligand-binding sensor domain-containing protein/signal transduction histidine kinase